MFVLGDCQLEFVCFRWRSLEGNDPSAYELIMKCQALQRRLIQAH